MKKIYLFVALVFISCVALFILSFVYLDKTKHKTYYYTVNLENHDIGTIKIEKFETEDKLIYKSVSNFPLLPLFAESKSRLVLDRIYNLGSYYKEISASGHTDLMYLENDRSLVSFVSRFGSEFICLDNIPIKKETFVFEEDSPETYLAILENYDFRKGRSQGFNALTCFSQFLPPIARYVTLTSVRDEYLTIDSLGRPSNGRGSRRIKTENLLLKIKNYPQGSIWVAKSDRSLIKLEMPKKDLKITRSFLPVKIEAKDFTLQSDMYSSENAAFKNKDVQLAGTITIPKKEGKSPAVLLVWGSGPQDRQYQGFFTCIADYLSKNGWCVLRFDKRGIGSSGGNSHSSTDKDIVEDVRAAIGYLAQRKEVDPAGIAVLAHSTGGFYAISESLGQDMPMALVLMAPSPLPGSADDKESDRIDTMASQYKWGEDYLNLVRRCIKETSNKVRGSTHNWISILRKRCFLKNMRDRSEEKLIDNVKNIKIPVLILQGREDKSVTVDFASILDKALTEGGSPDHTLIYYDNMGRYFGKDINDGVHRIHYEPENKVLEDIRNWLAQHLSVSS